MSGRSWRNLDSRVAEEIMGYLLEQGGEEQEVKADSEV